jgi:hypothetical protein
MVVESKEVSEEKMSDVARRRVGAGEERVEDERPLGGDERLPVVRWRRERRRRGRAATRERETPDGESPEGEKDAGLDEPVTKAYWP